MRGCQLSWEIQQTSTFPLEEKMVISKVFMAREHQRQEAGNRVDLCAKIIFPALLLGSPEAV